MHGGVNMIDKDGSKMSIALVFRAVISSRKYHVETDKMV